MIFSAAKRPALTGTSPAASYKRAPKTLTWRLPKVLARRCMLIGLRSDPAKRNNSATTMAQVTVRGREVRTQLNKEHHRNATRDQMFGGLAWQPKV